MKKKLSWSAISGIIVSMISIALYFYESFNYMIGGVCPACVHSTTKTIDFFSTFYEYMTLGSFLFLIFFIFNIRQKPKAFSAEIGILIFIILTGVFLFYINTQ